MWGGRSSDSRKFVVQAPVLKTVLCGFKVRWLAQGYLSGALKVSWHLPLLPEHLHSTFILLWGLAMRWQLIQGCTLPSPMCCWDRRHVLHVLKSSVCKTELETLGVGPQNDEIRPSWGSVVPLQQTSRLSPFCPQISSFWNVRMVAAAL